jgi:hypothetical protein
MKQQVIITNDSDMEIDMCLMFASTVIDMCKGEIPLFHGDYKHFLFTDKPFAAAIGTTKGGKIKIYFHNSNHTIPFQHEK